MMLQYRIFFPLKVIIYTKRCYLIVFFHDKEQVLACFDNFIVVNRPLVEHIRRPLLSLMAITFVDEGKERRFSLEGRFRGRLSIVWWSHFVRVTLRNSIYCAQASDDLILAAQAAPWGHYRATLLIELAFVLVVLTFKDIVWRGVNLAVMVWHDRRFLVGYGAFIIERGHLF